MLPSVIDKDFIIVTKRIRTEIPEFKYVGTVLINQNYIHKEIMTR
jgi:hypothetical protein